MSIFASRDNFFLLCNDFFVLLPNKTELRSVILKKSFMKKYQCTVCHWVYDPAIGDPEQGIEPGVAFENLPEEWVCPFCSVGKEEFEPVEE